jgi:hypothetical protein
MTKVEMEMMKDRIICLGVAARCPVSTHIFSDETFMKWSARHEPMDVDEGPSGSRQ